MSSKPTPDEIPRAPVADLSGEPLELRGEELPAELFAELPATFDDIISGRP